MVARRKLNHILTGAILPLAMAAIWEFAARHRLASPFL